MKIIVHNKGQLPLIDYRTLQPLQGSLKKFKKKAKQKLLKSWKDFGFVFPFFVWFDPQGVAWIIDGHGRRLLMVENEIHNQDGGYLFPYVEITADDETQAKQLLMVATSQYQKITKEGFKEFIKPLEFDWVFSTVQFDALSINTDPNQESPKDNSQAAVAKTTSIQLGDLIQLGGHRLICGNSKDGALVATLMDGQAAAVMVTDPPYGVEYSPEWRNKQLPGEYDRAKGKVGNDNQANWQEVYQLYGGGPAYIWHAGKFMHEVLQDLEACELVVKAHIIWVKNEAAISRGDYHWKHEACFYAVSKGARHNWQGSRKQNTVWEIDKPLKSETGHGTQKPIECMARPIRNNSKKGQVVYDPFLGSGTTMDAAQQLGRVCYAMELNPLHCQRTVNRMLSAFPGLQLQLNGQPWDGKEPE